MICGTRKKGYSNIVRAKLNSFKKEWGTFNIIEGCCPDSADAYAEAWAKENNISIKHFPGTDGTYLKRNIEMVKEADRIIAFWDGFSYGTCHTIAWANHLGKLVEIVMLR